MCPSLVRVRASDLTGVSSPSLQTTFLTAPCCFPQPSSHGFCSSCYWRGTASVLPDSRSRSVSLQESGDPASRIPEVELHVGKGMESGPSAQMEFPQEVLMQHKCMELTHLTNCSDCQGPTATPGLLKSHHGLITDNTCHSQLSTCNFDSFDQSGGPIEMPGFHLPEAQVWISCVGVLIHRD